MTNPTEGLRDRIEADMKQALRSKDKARLATIRLIWAAIKQREVDERITLDDTHIMAVLDKMLKQRRDSISQYENAGRPDLAEKESDEIGIIQTYLPEPLTEDEIDAIISEAIAATGANSPKDMGKLMGTVKPRVQGRADMNQVSAQVKKRLAASGG